jgi:hypothetical protein
MGTPGELGTFTQIHADVQIMGRFVEPQPQDHGEYDYFDFEMDSSSPGMPKSWGGVSGGGLWRVLVYHSPETGKIDWAQRLKGVAFWESAIISSRCPTNDHLRAAEATVVLGGHSLVIHAKGVPAKGVPVNPERRMADAARNAVLIPSGLSGVVMTRHEHQRGTSRRDR